MAASGRTPGSFGRSHYFAFSPVVLGVLVMGAPSSPWSPEPDEFAPAREEHEGAPSWDVGDWWDVVLVDPDRAERTNVRIVIVEQTTEGFR